MNFDNLVAVLAVAAAVPLILAAVDSLRHSLAVAVTLERRQIQPGWTAYPAQVAATGRHRALATDPVLRSLTWRITGLR